MLTPSNVTLAQMNTAILNGNETFVRIVFPVQNITLTDDNVSSDGGITINGVLNPDNDLVMGRAVSTEVVIRLLNGSIFTGFDWTEEFHIDFGVKISNSVEWVTVGYFQGKKPRRTVGVNTIEFTAYDRMMLFNELADDFIASLTFPTTMADIYHDLCTYVGLNYTAGDEMQNAMAITYTENPFVNGVTCRDIMSYIAEANCCYAKITAGGDVKLIWFTDQTSNYTLTEDDHFGVDIDEVNTSVIDSVRISSTEDESAGSIYPVGNNNVIYQILDNPMLLALGTADRTTVMADILTRLSAFGAYTPSAVNSIGNWMVETGDIIEVEHDGGQTLNMPVFVRGFMYDGGCGDVYECTGNADREMTPAIREQYETGGRLGQKYTIVSGVDIDENGVEIRGNKYLRLISGGTLDVRSQNFTLNSSTGEMIAGNWTFHEKGMFRKTVEQTVDQQDYTALFEIGEPSGVQCDQGIGMYTYLEDLDDLDYPYGFAFDFRRYDEPSTGIRIANVFGEGGIQPNNGSILGGAIPAVIPIGFGDNYLGHPKRKFSDIYVDHVHSADHAGGEAYSTLSALITKLIDNTNTGDVKICRFTDALTGTFFNSSNSYGGVLIILKASSNNAYFFAFNRAAASIGNISITNSSVNSKTMLS